NDNVIFRAITLFAEDRLERAAPFEDEDDFVGTAVLVIFELTVRLLRPRAPRCHVLVEQNRDAPAVEIAATRNVRGLQMVMTQRTVRCFLQLFTFQEFDAPHTSGRTQMIHYREGFVETFGGNDVLVGDAFVFVGRRGAVAMKPDVMLSRNL